MEALSNIASSIACILAASTLEHVQCPSSLETIGEMVMSPACNCSSWISYQIFSRGKRSHRASDPHAFFSSNNFRKTKTATAPLAAKIVQHYGPQKIRHNMLELFKDCRVPKQKNAILYDNHWPQKNSAEVMKDRQSINLILRTLLDPRLLLLHSECELLPSCTKTSPQTSLPKFQSSLPHGSHIAPGALLTSITVARCV